MSLFLDTPSNLTETVYGLYLTYMPGGITAKREGWSEAERESDVKLAASEIIRDCVLEIVDVRDPIVAADV